MCASMILICYSTHCILAEIYIFLKFKKNEQETNRREKNLDVITTSNKTVALVFLKSIPIQVALYFLLIISFLFDDGYLFSN